MRDFDTRVVVPLVPTSERLSETPRLNPHLDYEGELYSLETQWIVAVPRSRLGRPIGNLSSCGDLVIRALDALFTDS